jgi:hypothetical protein
VAGAAHALRITVNGGECIDTWFHARGADVQGVQVAGVPFSGRWLHLRQAGDGQLLQATTHAGAQLQAPPDADLHFIEPHAGAPA